MQIKVKSKNYEFFKEETMSFFDKSEVLEELTERGRSVFLNFNFVTEEDNRIVRGRSF
jgi:hypothetical protein